MFLRNLGAYRAPKVFSIFLFLNPSCLFAYTSDITTTILHIHTLCKDESSFVIRLTITATRTQY